MVFYYDFYSSMVYWYNNIWSDMGSLYIHNIRSILHEDNIRIQYTKGLFVSYLFFTPGIKIKKLPIIKNNIEIYRMDL